MDNYVTGAAIKSLREAKRLTQEELAERIHVSAKAVSKWETGKGVIELLSGEDIRNRNRAFNMLKSVFYVCPACGNVICATGEAVISCCGIVLPPLTHEPTDESHQIRMEFVEDERFVLCGCVGSRSADGEALPGRQRGSAVQARPRRQPVGLLQPARAFPPDAAPDRQSAADEERKGVREMKQEVIAGVILCAMGLAMLLISPNAWWKAAEKWKTRDGSGPAKSYTVLLRVVGAVFFAAGAALTLSNL